MALVLAFASSAGLGALGACSPDDAGTPNADGGPSDATTPADGADDGALTDGSAGDGGPAADGSDTGADGSHPGDAGTPDGDSGTGPVSCAKPVALTSTVGGFFSNLVVDDQFAYWYEPNNGSNAARVAKVPVDGSGPSVDLFNEDCGGAGGGYALFDSDVNNIYIVCYKGVDATHIVEIMKIPKSGAAPTPLFIADVGVPELNLGVQTIGVFGTNLYFSCCNTGPELYSIPVGGGTPTPLLPTMPYSPFVNGFFYIKGFGGNIYWRGTYTLGGSLLQAPAGGGAVALLANDDALRGPIDNMVIHDSSFYWRRLSPQTLWRLPLTGGTPTQLAAMPEYGSYQGQIEIFGNYIYFAAYDGSAANNLILLSYPLQPAAAGDAGGVGTPTIIATIPRPAGFAPAPRNHVVANSTHLFISDPANVGNNGHIYRCD